MVKRANIPFRTFIYEKWQEHQEEIYAWTQALPEYNQHYYFMKHRWMLRRIYQSLPKK